MVPIPPKKVREGGMDAGGAMQVITDEHKILRLRGYSDEELYAKPPSRCLGRA